LPPALRLRPTRVRRVSTVTVVVVMVMVMMIIVANRPREKSLRAPLAVHIPPRAVEYIFQQINLVKPESEKRWDEIVEEDDKKEVCACWSRGRVKNSAV
jgi:hypothetical protein